MNWIYLVYAALAITLFWGVKGYGKGQWNEECFSLKQIKMVQGFAAICILFHHMGQKTAAPWHQPTVIVHGLDGFINIGYFFVGIFLFCSGYGLFKSYKSKPDYLKGFVSKRIVPIVIAFYVSELIFLGARVVMGEKMSVSQVIYYVTGLKLANYYAWYVIALPFFYLFFYLAFRFCKKEGMAIAMTSLGIFSYILIGTIVDHNDWWMRGEWWYNTAHLFILGLLFAKFEKPVIARIKKGYWIYIILAFVGIFLFYMFSLYAQSAWSYYGETFNASDKVLRRWGCLFSQILTSCSFVFFLFMVTMKIQIGNKLLAFFGGLTLEFYLIHGLFVELFGYSFLDITKSLYYIRSVPLYVLVVVACSVPATVLFKLLLKVISGKKIPKKSAD